MSSKPEKPPITPIDFVTTMNATAAYILTRGLVTQILRHYLWMVRYLASYYSSDVAFAHDQDLASTSPPSSLAGAIVIKLFAGNRRRPPVLAVLLSSIYLASILQQTLSRLAPQFARSMTRATWHSFRSTIPTVPLALTTIIIVFITGDSWKILGDGFSWRFFVLNGLFILIAVATLVSRKDFASAIKREDNELIELARDTPGQMLIDVGVARDLQTPLGRLTTLNLFVLYVLAVVLNVLMTAILVAGALVAVGFIRIGRELTYQLSGQPANVIFHIGTAQLTSQLLSLSLSLGGFAGLYVAVSSFASNPENRGPSIFQRRALHGPRRTLVAFSVYQHAQTEQLRLTGIAP